jgi:hypothetical protein
MCLTRGSSFAIFSAESGNRRSAWRDSMLPLYERGLHFGRREFLRVGAGIAAAGYTLPDAWQSPAGASPRQPGQFGRAKSCILVYLLGGPPHQDMFDLKPEAPAEIRGPFQPIATCIGGVQICEHLPHLAHIADRFTLVRSVSHNNSNHTPMIYYTLTGRPTEFPERDNDVRPPQRDDFPHVGAILAKYKQPKNGLPGYIAIPEVAVRSSTTGEFKRARQPLRGGGAGILGGGHEPLTVNAPPGDRQAVEALTLPKGVSEERLERRARLLSVLNGDKSRWSATSDLDGLRQSAVALTGTSSLGSLRAFSLVEEPARVRDRYGRHRFGQTLLLARRLVQAGVPMIAVHWNEMTVCDGWDTHSKNFDALKGELLPMLDQGLSALVTDLNQRGLLDQTLVVCMGEFGRTPKINANAGRDHWGPCSTTLLAGGGVRGGQVFGASDKHAAYPVSDAVDPVDVHATIYHLMGIDAPATVLHDRLLRPLPLCAGKVIRAVL